MTRKPVVEDAFALCPHQLIQRGWLNGVLAGSVEYEVQLQLQEVRLRYSLPDGTLQDYELALDATPCQFGGLRWWALCRFCEQRRRTLYLPSTRSIFGCRLCFGLGYQTQRLTPVRRADLACQKLKTRYPIPRPSGRWRRTHLRGLLARAVAEQALWRLVHAVTRRG